MLVSLRNIAAMTVIAAAVALVYAGSLAHPFLFDDIHTIINNPYITSLDYLKDYIIRNPATVKLIEHQGWRPLWILGFELNYKLGGLNSYGYHMTNILIHVVNSVLVYFIALELFRGRTLRPWLGALAAGLVFAVHPINTEAVSYVTGRSASQAALFYLLGFYIYARYRESGKRVLLTGVFVSFVLALLSKEISVTFPLMLMAFEFSLRERPGRSIWFIAALIALAAAFTVFRLYIRSMDTSPVMVHSLATYWATQVFVVTLYVQKVLLPFGLNIDPDVRAVSGMFDPRFIVSILALVALLYGVFRLYLHDHLAGFVALWFFVALLPEGLMPITDFMAERRVYLPFAGLAVLAGWCLERLMSKKFAGRVTWSGYAVVFASVLVIVALGLTAFERDKVYASDETLWTDTVKKSPHKSRPLMALGRVRWREGRLNDAERLMTRAVDASPTDAVSLYNLGQLLSDMGRLDEAAVYCHRALDIMPGDYKMTTGLGMLYAKLGRDEDALYYLKKVVASQPDYANGHYGLGLFYLSRGRLEEAVAELEAAVRLAPDDAEVRDALVQAYSMVGQGGPGKNGEEAVKLAPDLGAK